MRLPLLSNLANISFAALELLDELPEILLSADAKSLFS